MHRHASVALVQVTRFFMFFYDDEELRKTIIVKIQVYLHCA